MRVFLMLAALCAVPFATADPLPSIEEKTEGMRAFDGYFDFYWDDAEGKIWLEVERWDQDFLYVNWLSRGLGSNPVGLDRAQLGDSRVVRFRRIGPKVLLEEPNQRFRAVSDDPNEARTVAESFASSVLWGGEAVARSDDRWLVDFTPFLLRDSHGVVERLKSTGEGDFRLDAKRSAVSLEQTRAFPKNTELEALLTFAGMRPGPKVRETAASADSVTLYTRHSLVELPDQGYRPRKFDPRAGVGPVTFADYAAPIDAPLHTRWIRRHRLQKKDPTAERSAPVEPIVYYVDRGAPEPIRSALVEGARWWNEAFEAAGFIDGFRVEVLPEGADPLDLRYNVVNWVHRSTRGWSYGASVVDPRTGEILKGVVSLGSLRVRQDRLLIEGLAPAAAQSPVEVSLARLRQLSAHEVGHTLGFAHNFATSAYGRESVMDYPAPLIQIGADEKLDFSNAYGVGLGAWDLQAVRYAYTDVPEDEEEAMLAEVLRDSEARGLLFISDDDSRPLGAMHPDSSLWDNGDDSIAALEHTLKVRRIGLQSFGEDSIRQGDPWSTLEQALVPLYLHHRYQVEATAKMIAGARFEYGVRGGQKKGVRIVPAERQRAALKVLLKTLSPEELALPEALETTIPPPAYGYRDRREAFPTRSGRRFDPTAAARTAADVTAAALFAPARAARLVEFHARDAELPSLEEVIQETLEAVWLSEPEATPRLQALRREAENAVLDHLLALAGDANADPSARAVTAEALAGLAADVTGVDRDDRWQAHEARRRIERFLEGQQAPAPPQRLAPPPGSPIGAR